MPWNCGGYVHVFLLGMLLAQFRVLMAELLSDVEDRTSIHYMFGFWVIQKGNIWIYVGFHRVFGWEWDLIGIYPLVVSNFFDEDSHILFWVWKFRRKYWGLKASTVGLESE